MTQKTSKTNTSKDINSSTNDMKDTYYILYANQRFEVHYLASKLSDFQYLGTSFDTKTRAVNFIVNILKGRVG